MANVRGVVWITSSKKSYLEAGEEAGVYAGPGEVLLVRGGLETDADDIHCADAGERD